MICYRCKIDLTEDKFSKNKKCCKDCRKQEYIARKLKYPNYFKNRNEIYKNNYESIRVEKNIYVKDYYHKNKEQYKKWVDNNRSKVNYSSSSWKSKNRGKCNATEAKRRASKLMATPTWLSNFDKEYIKNLYIQAHNLTTITGIKHDVDHIIPLQGDNVRGLHVPWNLDIITKKDNCSKGNKVCI